MQRIPSIRATVFILFLIAAGNCPIWLQAQFLTPSKEELRMTADPKAPGADAIYLDVDDATDDMLHSRIFYARIKILQEKGKELATIELPTLNDESVTKDFATMQLPYQSTNMQLGQPGVVKGNRVVITSFKARTIRPDGSIQPLEGKLDDLMKKELTSRHTERTVVTVPGLEVGSILEYRFVERYDGLYSSPHWDIQRKYFVRKAHFSFLPYKSFWTGLEGSVGSYLVDRRGDSLNYLLYYPKLPPRTEIRRDGTQRFILDVDDVPAAPQEEWMPPKDNLLYRVLFYYRSDSAAKDFWAKETRKWSKEVDRLAEPTTTIRDAVGSLTVKGDSDFDKARKLYATVQNLDNTDFRRMDPKSPATPAVSADKRAEETWTQKGGSSQDIALLYLAMIRAAGLTAYDMKVVDRDRSTFAPDYLYFDQLDSDIVIAAIGGKEVFLDPGQKMCPFQMVSWKHTGAGGIRESADGKSLSTTPFQPYTANTLSRMGDLTVGDQGSLSGTFRFTMTGQEALHWRQETLLSGEEEARKDFSAWVQSTSPQGLNVKINRFEGLTDSDTPLIAIANVEGSFIGSAAPATSQDYRLPSFPFEFSTPHPFVDEAHRLSTIDMHYGDAVTDQVTYHVPAGMRIGGAPQELELPWQNHAVFTVKTRAGANQITIARSLNRAFALAKAEDFDSLRQFYEKVATTDRQEISVTKAASPGTR